MSIRAFKLQSPAAQHSRSGSGQTPNSREGSCNVYRSLQILQARGEEAREIIEKEINCSKLWSYINLQDTIGLIEEAAALVTSQVLGGTIPQTRNNTAQALVLTEPLGVVLGIVSWNAPLVLAMRAFVAPIATGNTATLKGSELSPRTHYFIAKLFQEAGFPPGVLNFVIHRPEDAVETFDALIKHPAIRKCNFTGSTPVGRAIASHAAAALKPVLLELGGKNFALVLADADLDKAARLTLEGALLNNGQICMSTDTVLVARSVLKPFREKLIQRFHTMGSGITAVINGKSTNRLQSLIEDAREKGAKLTTSEGQEQGSIPATIIEGLNRNMKIYSAESFGPLLGLTTFGDEAEALEIVNACPFGLSAAIFTKNHFHGLGLAREMDVAAVYINGATVHDAPTLPHGGHRDSGWGRFGASWGIAEFVQTKTIILNE